MRKIVASPKLFIPVLFTILLISFVILHPGIKPRWDSGYRSNLLTKFIDEISADGKLDAQKYWYFRERYSPGNFSFNDEVIDLLQTFRIVNVNDQGNTELLYYEGKYLNSIDSISTEASLSAVGAGADHNTDRKNILLNTENILLTKTNDNFLELEFILPISEMKKANGFFDYLESENQLLENKVWVNRTQIKL